MPGPQETLCLPESGLVPSHSSSSVYRLDFSAPLRVPVPISFTETHQHQQGVCARSLASLPSALSPQHPIPPPRVHPPSVSSAKLLPLSPVPSAWPFLLPPFTQRMPPYLLGYGLDNTSYRKASLIPRLPTAPHTFRLHGTSIPCSLSASLHTWSSEGSDPQLVHDSQSVGLTG